MVGIDCLELGLICETQRLWFQHGEWTWMAFQGVIFNSPNCQQTVKRLLKNPWDFARFLRPFYGDAAATRFGQLLAEHLTIAVDLVKATVAGDNAKAEKLNKRLFHNAEKIAAFLASINPYWSCPLWRSMFFRHLNLAKTMAGQNIEGQYGAAIITYDQFEDEVLMMADNMARGLLRQFYWPCDWFGSPMEAKDDNPPDAEPK